MRKPKTNAQHGSDIKDVARLATEKSLRKLQIEFLPVSGLKLYSRNPRVHKAKQIQQLANCIRQFGFTNPVLLDSGNGVVARSRAD